MYFSNNKKKTQALSLARQAVQLDKGVEATHTLATVLLWNNQFAESIQVFAECLALEPYEEFNQDIINYLVFLLAKRQYHLLLQLFKETKFNLRERYRPIYYALMHKLQDEYPKELKRMGDELKETVEEILLEAERMAGKYGN
jgi:tetratricopeptide (TPR) repeat protein